LNVVSLTEKVLISWIIMERGFQQVWNCRPKSPFNASYEIHVITGKEFIAKTRNFNEFHSFHLLVGAPKKTRDFSDPKQKLQIIAISHLPRTCGFYYTKWIDSNHRNRLKIHRFLSVKSNPCLPGGFTALQNAGALPLAGLPGRSPQTSRAAQVRHWVVREAIRGLKPRGPLGSCFTYKGVMDLSR
jgi:hypothetical protein